MYCMRELASCFFFKQKTAYEMRISDWSSDVCSSDLHLRRRAGQGETARKGVAQLAGQPAGDGGIVGGGAGIGGRGQTAAQRQGGGAAVRPHLLQHRGVVLDVDHDGDEVVVLGGGADQDRKSTRLNSSH